MIILAIGDIDDLHWRYGCMQADVILSCGDVVDEVILEAAQACACRSVFAVKGNHDRHAPFPEPIIDLHLRAEKYGDYTFGGLNGSWQYKPRGHFLHTQKEVSDGLAKFPAVNFFLSHNSPRGMHDREDGIHCGFEGLNTYITRKQPKVLIHGHQHRDTETVLDSTRIIGVYGQKTIITH